MTFDIRNYYLQTPLDRPEYLRIKLSDILLDFFDEYNLKDFVNANGWVYFEIKTTDTIRSEERRIRCP